jgi:uncharacterized protein (TIGR03000 family)
VEAAAAGTITVDLPADADLVIGGLRASSAGPTRRFLTPALEPGQEYRYPVRAEVVRDGVTLTATKEVRVCAGQEAHVVIEFPRATAAEPSGRVGILSRSVDAAVAGLPRRGD